MGLDLVPGQPSGAGSRNTFSWQSSHVPPGFHQRDAAQHLEICPLSQAGPRESCPVHILLLFSETTIAEPLHELSPAQRGYRSLWAECGRLFQRVAVEVMGQERGRTLPT